MLTTVFFTIFCTSSATASASAIAASSVGPLVRRVMLTCLLIILVRNDHRHFSIEGMGGLFASLIGFVLPSSSTSAGVCISSARGPIQWTRFRSGTELRPRYRSASASCARG